MTDVTIKEVEFQNFRCFEKGGIELAAPDGRPGSGLTLLVGENGTGKTTVLDAIDLALAGRYRAETRISIQDFRNFERDLIVECTSDRYKIKAGSEFLKGKYFNCLGARTVAKGRDRKAPGKFLSSQIQAKCTHIVDEDFYYDKDDNPYKPDKPIDPRDKVFSAENLGEGVNVFYFDRNRARHLVQGTYKTTFEAICDDLNWKFRKELSLSGSLREYSNRASNDCFDWVLNHAQPHTGEKLAEAFSEFFEDHEYRKLRIDLFPLLEPFSSSSFSLRDTGELTGIAPKKLGSGIELVLALLLQKFLSDQYKGKRVYLIDEPELHLHPRAQTALAKLLIKEAEQSQIVVSSHSPYLLKELSLHCSMWAFRKTQTGIDASLMSQKGGLFPWSPSFPEVNYRAFRIPTGECPTFCV